MGLISKKYLDDLTKDISRSDDVAHAAEEQYNKIINHTMSDFVDMARDLEDARELWEHWIDHYWPPSIRGTKDEVEYSHMRQKARILLEDNPEPVLPKYCSQCGHKLEE